MGRELEIVLSEIVATRKCEMFCSPSCRIIADTPWKNPLNCGFPLRWSLMNFTLTVSIGVTAKMASHTPAPRPANNLPPAVNWPFSSCICVLNVSNAPKLRLDENADAIMPLTISHTFSAITNGIQAWVITERPTWGCCHITAPIGLCTGRRNHWIWRFSSHNQKFRCIS